MSVGAGKTVSIGFMAKHVVDKGGKVLVLARQGELVQQNADDAWAIGVKTSIFSASLGKKSTVFNCVMGTEGTVANHLQDVFSNWLPDCILIDECHQVPFDDPETQYMKIINHFKLLKPKVRIIGYTGSPYRGSDSITGPFWKKQLSDVGTMQLISMGFLVPPVFGFGDTDHHYDLSEFKPSGGDGTCDFTAKEMAAMGRKLTKELSMTQQIMEQVKQISANRNGVMITCASKKHCQQVAECLPENTWTIITDETPTKKRLEDLRRIKSGELKYVIQIGCLTTGFNAPTLDTCVILRKIGSLTLIIQLIGRVLRQLKPEHTEKGIVKSDALVLDYTDTLESMGDIYDDPIVNQALAAKKSSREDMIECPDCATLNSKFARRCAGVDDKGHRCEYFWTFSECKSCGTKNDTTAKDCRHCGAVMIDPNAKLLHKAYTDADFKPVKTMIATPVKGDGVMITYHLDSTFMDNGEEKPEVAREFLNPFHTAPHVKNMWYRWLQQHAPFPGDKNRIIRNRTNAEIAAAVNEIAEKPTHITHRINQKGYSVINRKKFAQCNEVVENAS
jgi:superfamily II DNA or RNA helicase